MSERRRLTWFLAALTALAAGVPAAALAGKRATSGQQTLRVTAGLTPAKAGARHVTLRMKVDYRSTKPGQQPPYHVKTLIVALPKGFVLDPKAAPACKRSQIDAAKGDVGKACPKRSQVGSGSVIVNAAPTIPTPIAGKISLYNAVNDIGQGQPKGTRNLVLWAQTSIGVNAVIAFRITQTPTGMKLVASFPKPKHHGTAPGDFSLQNVSVTLAGSGKKPYLTNPPTCSRGWTFAVTFKNWFGAPSISARDRATCSK